MTNWTTNVVCVSPTEGLGISNFNFLTVVPQHFFIDVIIPYEVTRGEDFRVNVKIFNYLSNKISVKFICNHIMVLFYVKERQNRETEGNLKKII